MKKRTPLIDRFGALSVRLLMSVAMLIGVAGGMAALSTPDVRAADPASFAAASVTPADVAGFVAMSADLQSPQYLLAQELLVRISGGALDPEDMEMSVEEMVPVEFGDFPELVDGEVAIAVQPSEFNLGMFETSLEVADVSDSGIGVDDVTDSFDDVAINSMDGTTFIVTASNIDEVTEYLFTEMREEAAVNGLPIETIEYPDGATILVLEDPTDPQAFEGELGIRAMAQLGSALVLASRVEDVEPFVQAAGGEIPALADDPDYQTAMSQMPSDVLVAGYSRGITPDMLSQIQEGLNAASIPIALDLITGSTGPSSFAAYASNEGFRFEMATLPGAALPGTPIAVQSPVDLSLADRVSSDTMLFVSGTDLASSTFMRAAEQLILFILVGRTGDEETTFTTPTEQLIADQYSGLEMLLGFNAQTDLFQQLVGEYGFAVNSINLMDPESFGVLFVSGVDDPVVVDNTLTSLGRLMQMVGEDAPPIEQVTVGDYTVNQITVTSEDMTTDIQYGVVGDELVVGVGTALLDYVLGATGTLSDNPLYQEALAYLPEPQTGVYYVNAPEVVNIVLGFASLLVVDSFSEASTEAVSSDVDAGITDAGERCAEYVDQREAQAAYDDDPVTNFDLDFDFDGVACDDFFTESVGVMASPEPTTIFSTGGLNIGALASVSYLDGEIERTSGILVVPGEE